MAYTIEGDFVINCDRHSSAHRYDSIGALDFKPTGRFERMLIAAKVLGADSNATLVGRLFTECSTTNREGQLLGFAGVGKGTSIERLNVRFRAS